MTRFDGALMVIFMSGFVMGVVTYAFIYAAVWAVSDERAIRDRVRFIKRVQDGVFGREQ